MTRQSFGRWNPHRASCGCGSCFRYAMWDADFISGFQLVGGQWDDFYALQAAYSDRYADSWKTRRGHAYRSNIVWSGDHVREIRRIAANGEANIYALASVGPGQAREWKWFRLTPIGGGGFEPEYVEMPFPDDAPVKVREGCLLAFSNENEGYYLYPWTDGAQYATPKVWQTSDAWRSFRDVTDALRAELFVTYPWWPYESSVFPSSLQRIRGSGKVCFSGYWDYTWASVTDAGRAWARGNGDGSFERVAELWEPDAVRIFMSRAIWHDTGARIFVSGQDISTGFTAPYIRYYDGDRRWNRWAAPSGPTGFEEVRAAYFSQSPSGESYFVGKKSGVEESIVYVSDDGGQSWREHSNITADTGLAPDGKLLVESPERMTLTGQEKSEGFENALLFEYRNEKWYAVCPPLYPE